MLFKDEHEILLMIKVWVQRVMKAFIWDSQNIVSDIGNGMSAPYLHIIDWQGDMLTIMLLMANLANTK